ncbi:MAG TPA: lamin tail domain-containing protein, partial [Bacteroidales bacterium]
NGRMMMSNMIDFNPQWLHYKMTENPEYKARFIDRAYRQLTKGGLLSPDSVANIYKSRAAQIDQAIIAESARWGDSKRSPSLTKATWLTQLQSMYTNYFPKRTDILKQQLLAEGLYTSVLTPDVALDGSTFYEEYKSFTGTKTLRLYEQNWMTSGNSFYYTLDDTDPRLIGGAVATGAKLGKGVTELTLNQTTILNARLYKSGVWGPLKKVVSSNADEDYSKLKVTELNYHPKDSIVGTDTISGSDFEFIEFKNTGNTAIDMTGLRLDSAIYYQFPNEKLLSPGAFWVVASKPNIFFSKYKMYPSGNFSKNLSNSGEEVILFNRNNKLVLSFTYDDNDPWPTSPDGDGFTLSAKYANPTGSPDNFDYWMASSFLNGSPFQDDYNALTNLSSVTDDAEIIRVYPNPTNGVFYVNVGQLTYGTHYQVSVYDTKGALILQNQFENTAVIDLNQRKINEGVYIVKVQTPSKMVTQKIIYLH